MLVNMIVPLDACRQSETELFKLIKENIHIVKSQPLTNHPLQLQGGLTSGRRPVVKIIAESLSQHDEKHVVPTPLSGTWVGGRDSYS
jgi:hypothetical protein